MKGPNTYYYFNKLCNFSISSIRCTITTVITTIIVVYCQRKLKLKHGVKYIVLYILELILIRLFGLENLELVLHINTQLKNRQVSIRETLLSLPCSSFK